MFPSGSSLIVCLIERQVGRDLKVLLVVVFCFVFLNLILFIYLFLAVLGLRCSVQTFSSCAGFSLWWLHLLRSTGCRRAGFSNCGSRALEHRLSSCGAQA